jgi:chemotaxis protein histidine kinase CheA
MDPAKRAELDKKLAKLRELYIEGLPSEFEALEAMLAKLAAGDSAGETLSEIHRALHKLVGSGGSFGFHDLSAQARAIEQDLLLWLDSGRTDFSKQDYEALYPRVIALKSVLDRTEGHQ